jgi:aerobic-type carbon monoxide dehydrogenase small subunit (CoxS/CutS family)
MDQKTPLDVNGKRYEVFAPPETSLLEVLRDELALTGTKYGCGESQCGACTVHLDGEAVHSCVVPLSDAAGKKVTTIEGISPGGKLHPVQQAFLDHEAMQCGYCVPGMIMKAAAVLKEHPKASDEEIVGQMNGNVCRCGGYPRMLAAIRQARDAQ